MAYVQKNNPIPRTGCGRRRMEQMTNPFKISKASLSKVSTQLKKLVNYTLIKLVK